MADNLSTFVASAMADASIFSKSEAIAKIRSLPIIEKNAQVAFFAAMGVADEDMNKFLEMGFIPSSATCFDNLFDNIGVRFGTNKKGQLITVEIAIVEVIKNGYFYLFWETLLRISKEFGAYQITLCDSAKPGFWTHHGFSGNDGDKERVLKLR